MQTGLNINSLDCHKTLLDLFHSETPNFFTELKHSKKKKIISRGNERERVDFERESFVWVSLRFFHDKVIRPFFFFAESVLSILVGEALQQRNALSNCKNHFRKRSTWALVQLCGYCYFGVSWKHVHVTWCCFITASFFTKDKTKLD